MTCDLAIGICTQVAAELSCVEDATELACVAAIVGTANVWIGGAQSAGAALPSEGWDCSGSPLLDVWNTGEPNDNGNTPQVEDGEQDNVFVAFPWEVMFDAGCDESYGVLCEQTR